MPFSFKSIINKKWAAYCDKRYRVSFADRYPFVQYRPPTFFYAVVKISGEYSDSPLHLSQGDWKVMRLFGSEGVIQPTIGCAYTRLCILQYGSRPCTPATYLFRSMLKFPHHFWLLILTSCYVSPPCVQHPEQRHECEENNHNDQEPPNNVRLLHRGVIIPPPGVWGRRVRLYGSGHSALWIVVEHEFVFCFHRR